MSGFDDGYNRLMQPRDGNWTAWQHGGMKRHNEQMMADMTARHHAANEQIFNQMYASANPPAAGSFGPLDKGTAKLIGMIAFVLIALGAGLIAYDRISDRQRMAARERVEQRGLADRREVDRIWLPRLERILLRYDARRDLGAIEQARALSGCHSETLARLMGGETRMTGCLGERLNPPEASVGSSVHFDRFVVTYGTTSPPVESRLMVMALNPFTRNARPGLGDDSPPVIARRALGDAVVDRLIGSQCIAIAGHRVARGQPLESGEGRAVIATAGLDVVSIACPDRGGLRIRATHSFRD